jgi:GT2 family glycosyltransferase
VSKNEFSIVIVTFNSAACILDLLGDIESCDEDILKRIYIVDNNSSDNTVSDVQRNYPRVNLIKNIENIGYGRAVNQAAIYCNTPFIFLLNPDIRLPENFFEDMLKISTLENIAAAGPVQYKTKSNKYFLNFCWSFLKFDCFMLFLKKKINPNTKSTHPIQVTFLNAGCLLIDKQAFDQVGGFDEKYFLYGEEPDIFLKFKLHKYKCYLHPFVEVHHLRDQSMKSLPLSKNIQYRLTAVQNIIDALVRGYFRVIQMKFDSNFYGKVES